jgi:very-short-patch-repair endonuclease/predicted transcriptional regulator of viral defense system
VVQKATLLVAEYAPPPLDVAISDLARQQHGVVALRQLEALGLSASTVRQRVARGRLHRIHRGVYALSPVLTLEARLMAAVLVCGDRAALSHQTGGAHLDLIRRPARSLIDVSVPRGGPRSRRGIHVHHARHMETTVVDGIRCTTVAQTLLDLCEVIRPFEVRKAITRAEQLRIFDLTAVEKTLAAAHGRRGAPILASLLADFQPVESETKLEDLLLEICENAALPRPTGQYWIDDYRADFAWPRYMVIAEADDWESYGTRTAFEKDRARLQDLAAEGWRVIPFTHRQITRDPERIVRTLRGVLTPSRLRAAAA